MARNMRVQALACLVERHPGVTSSLEGTLVLVVLQISLQ